MKRDDLPELIKKYEMGTQAVIDALGDVTRRNIDAKHPQGWSARQVVHHLADSETNSYIRLRRLIAEVDGTLLSGYDEGAWAVHPTLGYQSLPIDASLSLFVAVRNASAQILYRLSDADLLKKGVHSESGEYTIAHWFNSYTAHPYDHSEQIIRAYKEML